MAERYSSAFHTSMAITHKIRSTEKHNSVVAKHLIGDVKGKDCVVVDDMIDTAGTFCATAEMLKEKGANKVYGLATHGIFSEPALERIEDSPFEQVIVTNTVPIETAGITNKIVVLSVAKMLADAIDAVNHAQSVSALFEGQNQF
jgi:ribose-phosphate pyrophosphokinase